MKNKTVLYLINGLGVASKDSFDIKIDELMPNFSMLMRNYLYATLENLNYNYNNGFRNFSLGNNLLPTYNRLDSDTNLNNNETLNNIAIDAINNRTKVQIFCCLDNYKVIDHLIKIINVIKLKGNFKIFIHIILRQKDVVLYDEIMKMIKQLSDKITLLNNVEIGLVVGERKVNTDLFHEIMVKGIGEKWPDYNRKLNYVKTMGIKPRELDSFYVNAGFKLEMNDIAFFMNYEDVDYNYFISKITNVKLYTLFPIKEYPYAINVYEEIPPNEYFSKSLETYGLNCLILTDPSRVDNISYNLCGLKTEKSKNITYIDINDSAINIESILNDKYDYIIFDYDINKYKEISQIKEFLMSIDDQIDEIYKRCDQNAYNLFISSLYGIYKEYIVGVDKNVKLDYSLEIPVVVIDQNIPASKFSMKYGTTHDLSNTIFYTIVNQENIPNLFRKKGIFSLFKE